MLGSLRQGDWPMLKALMLAAALLPLTARAEPPNSGPDYSVHAPSKENAAAPHGWGLFVATKGQSLDLSHPGSGWSEDPEMRPGDFQAGFGWRKNAATAVLGYQQADYGPKNVDAVPLFGPHRSSNGSGGVIGLGFTLH
jgi:hypothetical protein